MTPQEYEYYIGSLFSDKGYRVDVSPLSNDWGIDVIAVKGDEKIGVQAKMYGGSSRVVNRRVVMELYGAAAYQDCTKAVLATDGDIMPDARRVADKLGIEIMYASPVAGRNPDSVSLQAVEYCEKEDSVSMSFDEIWERYIMPLKGLTLHNSRGSNRITAVDWSGVRRITSSGNVGKIDIEGFRFAYNHLVKNGMITRDYINQQIDKRCSSGIVLILGQIPFVETVSSPMALKLK